MRERFAVTAFAFQLLAAFLTDDESREGAIHCVTGHLERRRRADVDNVQMFGASMTSAARDGLRRESRPVTGRF